MVQLLSFHGKQETKDKYVARMRAHMEADELVQGTGFEKLGGGKVKGCAVGCTLDNYSHVGYEEELGIPFSIAILEDRIFEMLPWEQAKTFPLEFLEAVPVGKNLDNVWRKFDIWMLLEADMEVFKRLSPEDKQLSVDIAQLLQKGIDGKEVGADEWKDLAYRADRADRAYLADRADRAYLAYLADRAYLAPAMRAKLIQLLKEA